MIFGSSKWVNVQSCMKHESPTEREPLRETQTSVCQLSWRLGQLFPGCFGPSSSLLLPRMRSFLPLGTPVMKPNFVEPSLALGWLHSFLVMESDPRWPKFAYYWFWDSLIQFHTLRSTQSLDFTQWNDHGKGPQALSERRWSAFQWSDMRGTWTFRPAQHIGRWPPAFKLPFKTLRVPGGWRLTGPESVTFYRNIKKKQKKDE